MTRIPEPALVRSFLITLTGVVAYALGRNVDTGWIDAATTLYGLIAPMIAGLLIRSAVTPVAAPTQPSEE